MAAELLRVDFELIKKNLTQEETEYLSSFKCDDGTHYLDNDMIETEIKTGFEIPARILKWYKEGLFEGGLSYVVSR